MNKKILIVVGSFKTGGAERMAINTGESLHQNGYEVHYFLQRGIIEIPNQIDKERIYIANPGKVRFSFLSHLISIFKIFYFSLKFKPFVVIGYTHFSSFISCFSFSRRIIARFDIYPYRMNKPYKHLMASFVSYWPFVLKIIVPSYGIGNKLKSINSKFQKKIHTIHNSIDADKIKNLANASSPIELPERYISAMGRIRIQKNFELLIDAFAASEISKTHKLLIIGDGPKKTEMLKMIHSYGLDDQIIITGFLSNPFPVVKNSSLFVNPSLYESFCNVILEAAILDVPVIATDCEFGPSEIIKNGYNGILVENENLNELVKALDSIALNENIRLSLVEGCKKSFAEFELDSIKQNWLQLLESIK
jgi:glycosyltransferase involved in cell wall biosynthesis